MYFKGGLNTGPTTVYIVHKLHAPQIEAFYDSIVCSVTVEWPNFKIFQNFKTI